MGKKKKFIDKKKSATFQLLARDSSDPNYTEGPSADQVFVRVDTNNYSINTSFNEQNIANSVEANDSNSIFADAPDDYGDIEEEGDRVSTSTRQFPPKLPDHMRREILELGFPDDGYNYLSHLREIKNTGGGSAYYHNSKAKLDQLPRDVKAYDASRIDITEVNDDSYERSIYSVASKTVGVRIEKAVDSEVAALLDDSDLSRFGSDAEDLEEDFVVNANLPEEPTGIELDKKLSLAEEPEVIRKEGNESNTSCSERNVFELLGVNKINNHLPDVREGWVDEKPRVRRFLDEQFDLLELQEYGTESEDEYNGAIAEENEEHESLGEKLNHALKDHVMDDLELDEKYIVPSDLLHDNKSAKGILSLESAADVIHRCMEYAEKYENDDQDEDVVVLQESSDESEVWDCETIISTYSNLDHHPGKIEAPETRRKKLAETVSRALRAPDHVISLKGKEKLPVEFLPSSKKPGTEKVKDASRLKTERQKRKQRGQESKEEKKERKAAVKEERREARLVKKEMKGLYRCEAQHAQKVAAFTGPSSIHLM